MSTVNQTYSLTYDLPIEANLADYELLLWIFDNATVNGECWEPPGSRLPVSGYVRLTVQNTYRIGYVHRYVCHLFHGLNLDYRKFQCHHLCENKVCCRPSHLVPLTIAEHQAITYSSGQYLRGEQVSWSVLTDAKVVEYRRRYAEGETCPALAKEASVDPSLLWNALHGVSFAHLPGAAERNKRRDWRGEVHASAVLKEVDIIPIYSAYWTGKKNTTELGRDYGVDPATIRALVSDRTWKHVKRPTIKQAALPQPEDSL